MSQSQLYLFEHESSAVTAAAASNGISGLLRAAMHRAAAASPYSRVQIVDRMNRLALASGKRMTSGKAKGISLDTLEKWLNPESDAVPPLQAMDIFMRAIGNTAPLEAWAASFGCGLISPQQAKKLHWANEELERKVKGKAHKRLEEELLQEVLR